MTFHSEFVIFDIEADGLLDTITKIHCVSYATEDGKEKGTLLHRKEITEFFSEPVFFIGHNVIGYDFKALEKIYAIQLPARYIDTLPLSWYLNYHRANNEHGLESYGDTYGVPKPIIDDWRTGTIEEYTNRCETDVEINRRLWNDLRKKLEEIYS